MGKIQWQWVQKWEKIAKKNRCLQRGNAGLGKDPKKLPSLPSMKEKGFLWKRQEFSDWGIVLKHFDVQHFSMMSNLETARDFSMLLNYLFIYQSSELDI